MVIVPVLLTTGVALNSKFAAVSDEAETPSSVIDWPSASVITALPSADVAEVRLDVGEARDAVVADEVDAVGRDVEAVHDVIADRLREDELVRRRRAGQRIVARPGEDRLAGRVGFDVARDLAVCRVVPSALVQVAVTLSTSAPE